ncbi:DUF4169 family protein [Hyphomicrobium sp.]|uniref:DUF4169 family protein n=1 Tax=Hyphomicrobium sp. TaxID=82 RepID=UPI002E375851|nr:DUF4169 family protein [Hyphomicrobium sp.]HEX2840237.1 DUF4169 family protein [Hyphomicrobium sp.]
MAAEIVNLRKARKARDRIEKEKRAEENRIKFGRTKAEREQLDANNELAGRRLEAHKRDTGEDGDNS